MAKKELSEFVMDDIEKLQSLNIREKYKAATKPIDYYKELDSLYLDSLGEGDRFFLQDFGIYNNELNDDEFMLRLRFIGGRISTEDLKHIARVVKQNDLYIIITARAGLQLHGLDEDNVLAVYNELKSLNINTWQSFGDNVRNITTDIFDGRAKENIIDVYPYIKQMTDFILKNPQYVGLLPRRISTGISGSSANGASFYASDLYFALAKKDDIYGFNVLLGGKNTEIAQDANIFLEKEDVLDFFKALIEAFNKHGLRFERERTRLFHLLEDIGIEKFKEYIQDEYQKPWQEKGKMLLEKRVFDEFEELKDGTFAFCYRSSFARIEGDEIVKIATLANENNYEIRIGTDQQIYILGLEEAKIDLTHDNDNRTVLACAGSEFCPYSYWNIKDETQYLPLEKIQEHRLLIGFSGCLRGCAKHEHADIGLVGLRSNAYGVIQKTARIYVGALYTFGEATARIVFAAVPVESLKDVLNIIIKEFEHSVYDDFEEFSKNILNKFSAEFLSLWFLAKYESKKDIYLELSSEKELLETHFKDSEFMCLIKESYAPAIEFLSLKLWKKDDAYKKLNSEFTMTLK